MHITNFAIHAIPHPVSIVSTLQIPWPFPYKGDNVQVSFMFILISFLYHCFHSSGDECTTQLMFALIRLLTYIIAFISHLEFGCNSYKNYHFFISYTPVTTLY